MVFLEVKKSLVHTQTGLLWGFNSKFPTIVPAPFICELRVPSLLPGVNQFSLKTRHTSFENPLCLS